MEKTNDPCPRARRDFLRYLAASPLLAAFAGARCGSATSSEDLISSADEALNVFDFQKVAQANLPPAHYGYLATGVGDDATLLANREGFSQFRLRVRRLIDVRKIDQSVELFGTRWQTPVVIAPAGSQKAFHPEGEMAVARAAGSRGSLQILSTVTTSSVEDVSSALGRPVWYQLYPSTEWDIAQALVERAEKAGCPVLVLTVDLQGGSARESMQRWIRRDRRECSACHGSAQDQAGAGRPDDWSLYVRRKPMFDGLDVSRVTDLVLEEMTWDFVRRLRQITGMRIVVKGIVTAEDADLCVEHGIDGIIVSNHGGRAEESGRSTIECLPEIASALQGRIPVLIDSGFRRGTDIFKALALGADAICIGRPYLWGLAAFGQQGVETVLDLLRAELQMVMKQAGTTSIQAISSDHIEKQI